MLSNLKYFAKIQKISVNLQCFANKYLFQPHFFGDMLAKGAFASSWDLE